MFDDCAIIGMRSPKIQELVQGPEPSGLDARIGPEMMRRGGEGPPKPRRRAGGPPDAGGGEHGGRRCVWTDGV